jgi:hypothetical protein
VISQTRSLGNIQERWHPRSGETPELQHRVSAFLCNNNFAQPASTPGRLQDSGSPRWRSAAYGDFITAEQRQIFGHSDRLPTDSCIRESRE